MRRTLSLFAIAGFSALAMQIPMPPNQVTDEEAKVLAEWVLEQG